MRVLLAIEREEAGRRSPGYGLRVRDLLDWLEGDPSVAHLTVEYFGGADLGTLARLRAYVRGASRVVKQARGYDLVVVAALNAPHMALLGAVMARRLPTVIDVCDSVLRTARARRAASSVLSRASSSINGCILGFAKRSCRLYISPAEVKADEARYGRRGLVLGPPPRPELASLDPFIGPADRIVVPADFSSYHNKAGFAMLLKAVAGAAAVLPPIELYGPVAPDESLPPGVTYRGWAPSLADVYRGNTVVYAPNVDAAGVQNKVWEAVCARRPVLVGREAAGVLEGNEWVRTFEGAGDLLPALAGLVAHDAAPRSGKLVTSARATVSDAFRVASG